MGLYNVWERPLSPSASSGVSSPSATPSPRLSSRLFTAAVLFIVWLGRKKKSWAPFSLVSIHSNARFSRLFFHFSSQQYLLNKWRRPITVPEPSVGGRTGWNECGRHARVESWLLKGRARIKKGHTAGSLAIIFIYLAVTVKLELQSSQHSLRAEPWLSDFGGTFVVGVIGVIRDRQLNSIRSFWQHATNLGHYSSLWWKHKIAFSSVKRREESGRRGELSATVKLLEEDEPLPRDYSLASKRRMR